MPLCGRGDGFCGHIWAGPRVQLVVRFIRTIPKSTEAVQALAMRAGIVVNVTGSDRRQLEAIISDRSAPQKHVWRAMIILATDDGCGTAEIMRRSGKSKPVVWRWQARFMAEGVEGLTRDKTRKPGKKPLPVATVQSVVGLALGPPPGEATYWTGRMLAKAAGVSLRSVQRILEAHQLAPHRIRMFKLSSDPKFAEKLKDVVGLYVDPPAHAVVLSVDEKSQIQALDRTQPGLPMKPGRAGTMTHDYKRHGTTTLFAALNILDGTVIGRNMQRHRHQEFIRFLNTIEAHVPAGKVIHAVVDNYATHKHPRVRQWLARHPRWTFHFTPTSASWLNAVEGFFSKLTRQRLKRGVFQSVVDLQLTINRFVADTNADPKPFVWTADPKRVLAAIKRGKQTLESVH
jgi:transposase